MPGLEQLLIFALFGILSGLIGGFLGVGGGTIYVPVLTAWFIGHAYLGAPFVTFIIGNSLFLTMLSGLSGSLKQWRLGNFHKQDTLLVGGTGAITALSTSILISYASWYDKSTFALVFTLMLVPLMLRMFLKRSVSEMQPFNPADRPKLVLVGALSGVVSALTGLGGGVIMVPLLVDMLNYPLKKAASVSLASIVLMAMATVSWYALQFDSPQLSPWQVGMLALPAVVPMGIGVLLSAPWGVRLSVLVPPFYTKLFFFLFFILVILQMHFQILG
ncbi:MAG: sulfite exporter TauE/SafE family protein [Bacteroidia bacterium]